MSPTDGTIEPVVIIAQAVYTTRQAADVLQVSVTSIRRACADGRLPAGRGCGSWRIKGEHLIAWATGPGDIVDEPNAPEPAFSELTDCDIEALTEGCDGVSGELDDIDWDALLSEGDSHGAPHGRGDEHE